MHGHTSDVVDVSLKRLQLLHRVVIVHTDKHIVTTADNPLLTGNEQTATDGLIGDFKRLDNRFCSIVVDVHISVVQTR